MKTALALALALCACRRPEAPLRFGTYNVRLFGTEPTDLTRLARVLVEVRADVVALQEVTAEGAVRELVARVVASRGPRYRYALSRCGGQRGMRVGFLYDPARATLAGTTEFPSLDPGGDGPCSEGDRSGFAGAFRDGDATVRALVVHLSAGSEPERVERRRAQWGRVLTIAKGLQRGAARVLVLGDANSTGWLDDAAGERSFIEGRAAVAGFAVETRALACTEYWRTPRGALEPSVLDHVLAWPAGGASAARVHGYCARLRCAPRPADDPPAEYATVSDHCPVTVDLAR